MIHNPKVSIVVIGYNIEKYIRNCLDSLINQDYDNYEIVFVNDGSKDSTLSIAKKYSEKYDLIKVIDKANGGIVSARKAGLKFCAGEYVCFVDGDDWATENMVTALVEGLDDANSFDIVQSNFYEQSQNGDFHIREQRPNKEILEEDEFVVSILDDSLAHFMFAKLFKRQFLLECRYLDFLEVTMAEDLMTNSLLGLHNPRVHIVDCCTYYYRYNASSCSRDGTSKLLEQTKTINYIIDKFKKAGKYTKYKELLDFLWFSYSVTYVTNMNVHPLVKRDILKITKPYIKDWCENSHCIKLWYDIGKKEKITFIVFYKVPVISSIYTAIYNKAISYKDHDGNIFKNKAFENKKVYDDYLDSVESKNKRKTIFLMGTSSRSNVGDHAIAFSEIEFLNKEFSQDYSIVEITEDCYTCEIDRITSLVRKDDVICITGGGFLGDLWLYEENIVRDIIARFKDNRVLVFPQTLHFSENTDNNIEYTNSVSSYRSHKNIMFFLRDCRSFDQMSKIVGAEKCRLFPDMALLNSICLLPKNKSGVLVCLRKDKEKILSNYTRNKIEESLVSHGLNLHFGSTLAEGEKDGDIPLERRQEVLLNKLEEFRSYQLIVTDRLHGMILSCLAGTPCIAFDNTSKKVSGVYKQWMTSLQYVEVVDSYDDFVVALDKLIHYPEFDYSKDYLLPQENLMIEAIKTFISEE